MKDRCIVKYLPNVWKEGQLFAYSGLDGKTDWERPLTGISLAEKCGFIFHSQDTRGLFIEIKIGDDTYDKVKPGERHIVTSDVVNLVMVNNDRVRIEVTYLFYDCYTILVKIMVKNKTKKTITSKIDMVGITEKDKRIVKGEILNLKSKEESGYLYAYKINGELNKEQLTKDFDEICINRLIYFKHLPKPKSKDEKELRTYYKAFSVLKANIYSPQGKIKYRWTTPDKYPHQHMWLWDSAFQAIGYKYINGKMGEDTIQAMLSVQSGDGYIPLCANPELVEIVVDNTMLTQPPTLAWATWNVYKYTKNKEFLKYCLPRLKRYIKWLFKNRDTNKNGLLEWYVRPNDYICPCGESGMDNSSRFLHGERIDSIDLSALVVNEIRHIELMTKEIGETEDKDFTHKKKQLVNLINEKMWDDEDKFYYDLRPNGNHLKIKTIASFFPLLAKVASKEQARYLIKHLKDPEEFWSEFPVRTLAKDEPSFDRNMWRGPVWINCNYLVICGLREYGYKDIANEISQRMVKQVSMWYNKEGSIFELYHDEGKSPLQLPRKDAHGEEVRRVLCDYGWSCAIYIELLLNRNLTDYKSR